MGCDQGYFGEYCDQRCVVGGNIIRCAPDGTPICKSGKHVTMVTHDLVSMLDSFYFNHFECDINLLQVGLVLDASKKVMDELNI